MRVVQLLLKPGDTLALFTEVTRQTLQALGLGIDQALGLADARIERIAVVLGAHQAFGRLVEFFDLGVKSGLGFGRRRFGQLDPAHQVFDRARHTAHGIGRAAFRAFDAGAEVFQRACHAGKIARRRGVGFVLVVVETRLAFEDRAARVAARQIARKITGQRLRSGREGGGGTARLAIERAAVIVVIIGRVNIAIDGARRRLRRLTLALFAFARDHGPDVLAFENHLVQPLAKRHA